jgi:protein-S-isoprenylcysteine O-methyltransferase Ste14
MLRSVPVSHAIALTYAVASRMAYVFYVGSVLRRQDRTQMYTNRFGRAAAFRRFRRTASIIMNHDAFAFVVLCVVTRNTWRLPLAAGVTIAIGATLAVIGLGTKLWAARTLGSDAYYWHNFFEPDDARGPVASGPYRFISSPMYTVGYLQTYGLALMLRSLPGVVVAGFLQVAILIFYFVIEKPHFHRLHRSS